MPSASVLSLDCETPFRLYCAMTLFDRSVTITDAPCVTIPPRGRWAIPNASAPPVVAIGVTIKTFGLDAYLKYSVGNTLTTNGQIALFQLVKVYNRTVFNGQYFAFITASTLSRIGCLQ
jgi:hypothetical protein